jgi:enoyl-CoA hydratase
VPISQRLPRAVGKSMAMQMCLTGASVSAQQALAAGLVSKVVTPEQLVAEALDIASSIARHSLPVLMAIKEAVGRSFESSLNEGLLFERRLFHAGFALHDQKEGMAAFLQKRAPEFFNK